MLFTLFEGALANPILFHVQHRIPSFTKERLLSYYFKGAAREVICNYCYWNRSPKSVLTIKGRAFKSQINHII